MDLPYLREHPEHLPAFLTHQRLRETPVSGGSICVAQRLTLEDGASVFAKSLTGAPDGFFAAEAAGLRWLREAQAVPVPEVLVELPELLALEWIEPDEPSKPAAERFGRDLADLHRAGADAFGAPWPGFIGRLPLDNAAGDARWAEWFVARRLAPFVKLSVDRGAISAADAAVLDRALERIPALGGDEPPARIHGDLWSGNVVWAADRVWLVDPAAHGGHRETDLALLALFGGTPLLERVIAAYDEAWPLADGWRTRVPAHQLYLLLVHTALFGGGYRDAVMRAGRALL
ncbi:fructosamine kinase [Virgisporangium aliadipatigenens]|uniref:Fructosamine kinase n=1 Tax=Virgisporangium aliadipatigenens TaxID=741659 RepID=A0A8J3YW34_9ACTN|nr:fructosamine kinase family protein [Virgisporangium aliadipatigenens]GIJ50768.1 fructosamine kinase [Virgisporangium aliadipatigenens]